MTLTELQKVLKAPKSRYNDYGGFAYRSCEDILEALKAILPDDAVLTLDDEITEVGGRVYVKSTACLLLEGVEYKSSGFAREAQSKKGMDESQITGTASTYARKYALNGLFLIDDTKDADTNEHHKQEERGVEDAKNRLKKSIDCIKEGIGSGDLSSASEAWFELTDEEKKELWIAPSRGGPFTTAERKVMQSTEFREANGVTDAD